MIEIIKKEACSGCSACVSACKNDCITMCEDKEGFIYPEVLKSKCVECGACSSACPIINKNKHTNDRAESFAVVAKNEKIRLTSSSGGVFSLLGERIVADGGIVYGAVFNKHFQVEHVAANNIEALYAMRGSKYVQSRVGDAYVDIENNLCANRTILFTGTPCQIAGLKAYLGREYDTLICADIVCHGVPSPKLWREYLLDKEKKFHSAIKRVSFRDKEISWQQFLIKIEFENNKVYKNIHTKDLYMRAFLRNFSLRPSCFECNFKGIDRHADITLADLWGSASISPELHDGKGTSFVIVHTEKGAALLEKITNQCLIQPIELDAAISHNLSLIKSEKKSGDRDLFMKEFCENGCRRAFDKFCKDTYIDVTKKAFRKSRIIAKRLLGRKG